jgi:hypothetical protein
MSVPSATHDPERISPEEAQHDEKLKICISHNLLDITINKLLMESRMVNAIL